MRRFSTFLLVTLLIAVGAAAAVAKTSTSTQESLSGLVTEEVEPGVLRIVDDGVRELTSVEVLDIVAGYDGGIYLLGTEGFFRLGSEGSHAWPGESSAYEGRIFEVAPDGAAWIVAPLYPLIPGTRSGTALRSADGDEWAAQPCPTDSCVGVTVAPDGKVWASWADEGGTWRVGHLGAVGWEPLDGHIPAGFEPSGFTHLYATDTGELYGTAEGWGRSLYRYEDGAWSRVSDFALDASVDVGRDGTVWQSGRMWLHGDVSDGTVVDEWTEVSEWDTVVSEFSGGLARFAGDEWTGWTTADQLGVDIPGGHLVDLGSDGELNVRLDEDEFGVAPDGSVWIGLWRDGLVRFDGVTTHHFLPGHSVVMDIATDGSVWALADGEGGQDLYVITPEAVVAGE
jgi:hypothetical protein